MKRERYEGERNTTIYLVITLGVHNCTHRQKNVFDISRPRLRTLRRWHSLRWSATKGCAAYGMPAAGVNAHMRLRMDEEARCPPPCVLFMLQLRLPECYLLVARSFIPATWLCHETRPPATQRHEAEATPPPAKTPASSARARAGARARAEHSALPCLVGRSMRASEARLSSIISHRAHFCSQLTSSTQVPLPPPIHTHFARSHP